MTIFLVQYTYDPARNADRDTHRPAHRAYLEERALTGAILVRGPLADVDGQPPAAALVVRADDEAAVAAILDGDPFYTEGIITERTIRPWTLIGPGPEADWLP